jgi:putative membrane protein
MIISEAEKARIAEAIGTAELKTAGEIFCVIAHSSSSYRLVPVAWAALIALAMPLPLIYLTNWPAGRIYLLQLLGFIISGTILSLPALRFRIVPKRAMHDRAHVEAMRQFLAQGIHLTEHRTGVLIFVSVGEHHAEIVADSGINAKVTPEIWQDAINATIEGIKHGRPADGLIAAVERCGTVLAEHFLPGTINRDEPSNKVVEM